MKKTFEKVLPSFLNQKFAMQQHLWTLQISHCSTYYFNIYYNIFLFHCIIFYRQNIFRKSIYIVQSIFYSKASDFQATYDADCLAAHNSTDDSQGTRIHIVFSLNCTVTSWDVNFRYPDRVTQTKFVPLAKKGVYHLCLNFLIICTTGIFRRCSGKNNGAQVWHELSTNFQPLNYKILYQCATASLKTNGNFKCIFSTLHLWSFPSLFPCFCKCFLLVPVYQQQDCLFLETEFFDGKKKKAFSTVLFLLLHEYNRMFSAGHCLRLFDLQWIHQSKLSFLGCRSASRSYITGFTGFRFVINYVALSREIQWR